LRAYHRRLNDPDPKVHMPAARAWSSYESSCSTLHPNVPSSRVPPAHAGQGALSLARIEAHYLLNGAFLETGELLNNVHRVCHLPCIIVQGRYDVVCPIVSADALARSWPGARYVVVPDAGHSAWEPGIRAALVAATEDMKLLSV
jgi:proline iminopeptidase